MNRSMNVLVTGLLQIKNLFLDKSGFINLFEEKKNAS